MKITTKVLIDLSKEKEELESFKIRLRNMPEDTVYNIFIVKKYIENILPSIIEISEERIKEIDFLLEEYEDKLNRGLTYNDFNT